MKIRVFAPNDYTAIVAIHNSMNIVWPERPRTPEARAEADQRRNPKCKHQRWVAAFDPSPYAGMEAKLSAQGIVLKTLRELESDPGRDRQVYDLYWQVEQDVPREEAQFEQPDFDEWLTWLNDPSTLPDAYVIAVRGDEYSGLRELGKYQDGNVLLGGLMGVCRDYRNRGIGLAKQLHGIAYARECGYRLLKDCTAVQNAPMQTLFNKLGYARDPEWQQCQKDIN